MQALRVIEEPLNHQCVIDLPHESAHAKRVEGIVLKLDDGTAAPVAEAPGSSPLRRPSAL